MKRVILDQAQHCVVLSKANKLRLVVTEAGNTAIGVIVFDRDGLPHIQWSNGHCSVSYENIDSLVKAANNHNIEIHQI